MEFDLLLGEVHSLKQKRSLVRPLIAEIRRKFEISVAETRDQQLLRRAGLGISVIATDAAHVIEVMDTVERLVAYRPELDLLSTRRGLHNSDDE